MSSRLRIIIIIIIIFNLKLAMKKIISFSVVECFSAFSVLSEMFCMSL